MSASNGESAPTHILVTDELVERACDEYDGGLTEVSERGRPNGMRAELWQAGYDAAQRGRRP